MSHQLVTKFKALMGHLNSEENELANEFLEYLEYLEAILEDYEEDSEWLGDLEAAGVDNWEGFDHACDLRRERKRGDV